MPILLWFFRKTRKTIFLSLPSYTQATLNFMELNTVARQREAIVQGRSLSPYRLRYNKKSYTIFIFIVFILDKLG
ncbi:MAG: hypothetical protein LBJ00_13100 [Planctomycetaceae bacterium]|nr:hypothetical protein [Planctomycetaceae bacterium]